MNRSQSSWACEGNAALTTMAEGGEVTGPHPVIRLSSVKAEMEHADDENLASVPLPTMMDITDPMFEHPLEQVALELEAIDIRTTKKKDNMDFSKLAFGPQCWTCYNWWTWWKCAQCKKSYHKEFAFFGGSCPPPIFNMSVEEALDAEKGGSVMIRCTECIMAEETTIAELKNTPEFLTKVCLHLASFVEREFRINNSSVLASPLLIKNSAMLIPGAYKTLEAFIADFELIKYQVVRQYGEQSEQTECVGSLLKIIKDDIAVAIMCPTCYVNRFDPGRYGRLLPKRAYSRLLEVPCKVPHPIIWVKEPTYSKAIFWPAKLLHVDDETGKIWYQCFEDQTVRSSGREDGTKFWFYSTKNPNPNSRNRKSKSRIEQQTLSSCERYVQALKARFGAAEVVIPEEASAFTGSYKAAFERSFPNLNVESLESKSHDFQANASTLQDVKLSLQDIKMEELQ